MNKEEDLFLKVKTLEDSIEFWNNKFDHWHEKLMLLEDPESPEAEVCAMNMHECWKRMEYEKSTAEKLSKEIAKYI
tara:strand:+ start:291 stop:518 length:228 start_codon:yes stop_codon:yes gene_type:complete